MLPSALCLICSLGLTLCDSDKPSTNTIQPPPLWPAYYDWDSLNEGEQEKMEETQKQAEPQQETKPPVLVTLERGGRIGLGLFTFATSKEDWPTGNFDFAGGLAGHIDVFKADGRWGLEIAVDVSFYDEKFDNDGIESRVEGYLIPVRVGAVYGFDPGWYVVGGAGFVVDKSEFKMLGYKESSRDTEALLYAAIGKTFPVAEAGLIDIRAEYEVYPGSDNATSAFMLTVGFWFIKK